MTRGARRATPERETARRSPSRAPPVPWMKQRPRRPTKRTPATSRPTRTRPRGPGPRGAPTASLVKTFTHRPRSLPQISESTVRRLSHYDRVLEEVEAEGGRVISSRRLAEREGITSAQVRKDLSCFGSFGRRGLGYDVARLREE